MNIFHNSRRLCITTRFFLLGLTALIWAWSPLALVRAQGADFYVSTQGNDSNPGTAAQPFRTITRAYSLASPGVTIIVMPGVYTDYQSGWGLHLGKSGTASSPIVLKSQVRGAAIIDGQNLSDRNKGIYLDGSYNIIDGFVIRGGPDGGITIWGNSNQILNNEIHHNGNPASSSTNGKDGAFSGEGTRDNIYRANSIHDNGRAGSNLDHGLYLCGDNEMVINNVLVRNAAYGLQIAGYATVSNLKVYNNVMAFNGRSGIILWMAVSGVDIKNNILYQNGSYGIDSWEAHGSGVVMDRNLVFGNGSGNYSFINGGSDYSYTLGTTISSAPLFVNSSSGSFNPHLSASSPCINAGLNLSSTFTTDMDGAARPASGVWDQGVYRNGSTGNTDTTPPTVSLSAPANNATVSGSSVAVSASASDNIGVAGVQFKLDGANLSAEDTSAPYGVTWNTTAIANGSHTLSAVARDAAGNWTTATVSVLVNNNLNTAPTISSVANVTIAASASTAPLAFSVSDAQTAAGSLTVSGSSSNPTLVPSGGIVFGGSGSSRTVKVTPAANRTGTATITLTVSDGSLSRSTSFVLTVNSLPSSGLTFASTSGAITAPFIAANGTIYQTTHTSLPGSGRAAYSFTIVNAGNYTVAAQVNAPNDGANSFFVNIDAEPTDPLMVWDIPITTGLASRTVSWRGSGTPDSNQFAPKVFTLSAGTHQLIVRGREANCQLGTITVAHYGTSTAPVVTLTSPVSGASYAAPATINLAASVVPNGHTITKVQFFNSTTLVGEDATAPYGFAWGNVSAGSYSLSARAVYDSGSTVSSSSISVAVTSASSGLTFGATSGAITAPFIAANGTIYQTTHTSLPGSGRAAYSFTIVNAGNYTVAAQVNAPDDGANSYFVNIDAEPTDPLMIWDIPITAGSTKRTVSWRGSGTPDSNQFAPKVFTLSAGAHQLIVRGREANCQLGAITIAPAP